jgi:hypothetical protein
MPDWKELVRQHLSLAGFSSPAEKEVFAELAAHLEDDYEEGIEAGLAACEAERRALARIPWRRLARKIHDAKLYSSEPGRNTMNDRAKKLWLPALASLTLTAVLLLVFDKIHAGPLVVRLGHLAMALQLAWFAALPIAGRTAPEEAMMNQRTRSIWLPGFVSLTAASLLMFAEEILLQHDSSFYFTGISLHPGALALGLPSWFYLVWLLVQLPCGALGAFLSRRGGGTRIARIVAGAFPALAISLLFVVVIPVSVLFERNSFVYHHPYTVAFGILIWVGAPAIALLIGTAPFLKQSSLQGA